MMMQRIRSSVKWFIPLVAGLVILGLLLSRVVEPDTERPPQPEVELTADQAAAHLGRDAKVCGTVASAEYLPGVQGQPTFLNFGRPHPAQDFTAVIFGDDRGRFPDQPETVYNGREICVTGRIREHQGGPQIILSRPEQLRTPGQ